MAQTTNQGEMFYRMKYLGGDTPAHRISGDRVRCLIEDEAYEVYLRRTIENDFPPYWMLTIHLPGESDVIMYYWHIEDFVEEWEDL